MFNELKGKLNQLAKAEAELHEVSVKRGSMMSYPHYDPAYSSAKVENWGRDVEKLQEKVTSIHEEIAAVQSSEGFKKDIEARNLVINTKRDKLRAEYDKLQQDLIDKRGAMDEELLNGGDPLKMAVEFQAMQDRRELVIKAIESCNSANQYLTRMSS